MKKSSFEFNTNVEKMRRITNSLEQKGDTEQLRYIRDGLYHVGGLYKNSLKDFAQRVIEKLESPTKRKERLKKERDAYDPDAALYDAIWNADQQRKIIDAEIRALYDAIYARKQSW